jgi:chemotaxis protein methyltransferase CheR
MSPAPTDTRTSSVSATDFEFLRSFLAQRTAIQIAPGQEYLVESRLDKVARQHSLPDVSAVLAKLRAASPALANDVIDAMTTNETSFFRDQHPFDDIVTKIIPDLVSKLGPADPLTIWCAACSSGQEPYTLAILLNEHFGDLVRRRRVRIVATDLSSTMVGRTKEGKYSQFEVNRGLPAKHMITYFQQQGRDWQIRSDLRDLIDAKTMNLLEAWNGVPRCDLVLIRNVLIYFPAEVKHKILGRIKDQVLKPNGYLLLGSSETMVGGPPVYETSKLDKATCYRPLK